MPLSEVEFECLIRETHVLQIDLDASLDQAEKEELALQEFREEFPDVERAEILEIKIIHG